MTLPTYTDYFGGCPICWKNDGYLNLRRVHVCVCHAHKKGWNVGENLFSSWREEDESVWRRNSDILSEYESVEPAMCLEPLLGGYINEVALRQPGVGERHAKALADFATEKAKQPPEPQSQIGLWDDGEIPF